jgi:glyoxylase-like metal-dependent hydrolase (beta-lactamase superfamily II)
LLNPEKFWDASVKVLGDIAEMYGQPQALPPDFLLEQDSADGITVLETPGHAPHHLSFIVPFRGERLFFVGEAAGLHIPGTSKNLPYLRPTTPPRFDGDAAKVTLNKIEENLQGNELLCYSHYGAARQPRRMIALAKEQYGTWLSFISQMRDRSEEEIADALLSRDPLLSGLKYMPEDLRQREYFFICNSIQGFLGYLTQGQIMGRESP